MNQAGSQRHATPAVYAYVGLISLFFMTPGNIAYPALQFIYKNQLHFDAQHTAIFKAIINAPGYFGFVFGFLRDRIRIPKMGDRGWLLFGAFGCAVTYLVMARADPSALTLGAGLLITGFSGGMLGASFNALMRNISQVRLMTGRMSSLYFFMSSAVPAIFVFVGGYLIDRTSWRTQLLVVAVAYGLVAVVSLWRPKSVLDGVVAGGGKSMAELASGFKLLLRHRGYWIAVAIWGLWNFAPAALTPMQYFLNDVLKMNGTQYGIYNALSNLSFLPSAIVFGLLCKRFTLWRLIVVATILAVPQWAPVMFVTSANGAYAFAIFLGISGGLANVAYWGVLLRACPEDLAGTGMLVGPSLAVLAAELGNILGGYIFDRSGFTGCSIATTIVYAFLVPIIFMLPKALVTPRDDEHVPTEQELAA